MQYSNVKSKKHSTCVQHIVRWKNTEVTCNRHQAQRSICFNQLSFLSEEVWYQSWDAWRSARLVSEPEQGILAPILCLEGYSVSESKAGEPRSRFCSLFNTDSLHNLEQDPTPHLPPVGMVPFIHFPVHVCLVQPVPMRYFQVTGSRVPGKKRTWLF